MHERLYMHGQFFLYYAFHTSSTKPNPCTNFSHNHMKVIVDWVSVCGSCMEDCYVRGKLFFVCLCPHEMQSLEQESQPIVKLEFCLSMHTLPSYAHATWRHCYAPSKIHLDPSKPYLVEIHGFDFALAIIWRGIW